MTEPGARTRRILIGASCFTDALSAFRLLDAAEGLAASEIRGLLIASNVFDEVADPCGPRVVTPSGALIAAPVGQGARALIESDAKAFRRRVASMAQAFPASWSFEMRTGELAEMITQAESEHDLVIVGYRPEHRRKGCVVLLTGEASAWDETTALAEGLSRRLRLEVVSLLWEIGDKPEAATRGAPPPALLARLNRINAEAVVVDAASVPLRSPESLRALLAAARCPVLVLRAAPAPEG